MLISLPAGLCDNEQNTLSEYLRKTSSVCRQALFMEEPVSMEDMDKICIALNCSISDAMELNIRKQGHNYRLAKGISGRRTFIPKLSKNLLTGA